MTDVAEHVDNTKPSSTERPLLRYRNGDDDDWFEHDVRIVGTIRRVDEDTVTIFEGPNLTYELYVEDFAPLFDDDEAFALAILTEAALNSDVVTVALTKTTLAYGNQKQAERFAAGDAPQLAAVPSDDELDADEEVEV